MSEAVILTGCRTPVGKFQGTLADVPAPRLGATVVRDAIRRVDVAPRQVDEVIMGCVLPAGMGQAPARQAALEAGLPASVAALTINKMCGSGLKAVMVAAQAIQSDDAEVVVAGGIESMSRAPYLLARRGAPLGDRNLMDSMMRDGLVCSFTGRLMGQIAERLAAADGITRLQQDQYAAQSHQRAAAAEQQGLFQDEIVPVFVAKDDINPINTDEGPRPDTTAQQLSNLPPVFEADGTVTAGNSSMISDGAAAVVVTSRQFAESLGRRPLARIICSATSGGQPEDLFVAPVLAMRKVLTRAGVTPDEVDLWEINEAFAVQMLACLRRMELCDEKVNINGGAIAIGHPVGASGARVLISLLHSLRRTNGRYGLASLCLGGGNAVAMLVDSDV